MQFNRKWFSQPRDTSGGEGHHQEGLANPDNILWFLKKNGFVQRDGSDITDFQNIRWQYDMDNKIFFQPSFNSNWSRNFNLCWQYNFHSFKNLMDENILYSDINDQTEFFIPLKNKGFIINNNRYLNLAYGFTPTPPLNTLGSMPSTYDSSSYACMSTVICIFNNVINKYTYLYGNKMGSYTPWNYARLSLYMADQVVSEQKLPLVEQTPGNGTWGSFGNYTDVKQNICTLIKYPYNNGFMSNLFLITTAPRYGQSSTGANACGLDNKFFSFNGRNFYGVYTNLAVELPAN